MRSEFVSALRVAREVPQHELPHLLGELEEIRCTAIARLLSPGSAPQPDRLLSITQAAERLDVSADYLYRNHNSLPLARRVGKRLLFSESGLQKYIAH